MPSKIHCILLRFLHVALSLHLKHGVESAIQTVGLELKYQKLLNTLQQL